MNKSIRYFALGGSTVIASVLAVAITSTAASADTYQDVATGFCLDSNANRQVYTLGCNGGSYQKWSVSNVGSVRVLKNVATGFCLDSNANGQVYALGCNGGSYQKWKR